MPDNVAQSRQNLGRWVTLSRRVGSIERCCQDLIEVSQPSAPWLVSVEFSACSVRGLASFVERQPLKNPFSETQNDECDRDCSAGF